MKLQPLGDRVVVERLTADEKTAGGIVLPDTAKEKPKRGRIVAVGTGRRLPDGKLHPLELKKGDEVIFASYSGDEVKAEGKEMLLLREEDVLAVIES
jgi:chaperonin GroES